jgi:hypothetical protein
MVAVVLVLVLEQRQEGAKKWRNTIVKMAML